ncbi:helix-turn-helix domain-containing protein [Eionea flava]
MIAIPSISARSEPIRRAGLELLPCNAYSATYTPDSPSIGFAFDAQVGVHAFASDKRQDFYRQAHSFAFTPAGCDVYSESSHGGEYLKLSVGAELLADIDHPQPISQIVAPKTIRLARDLRYQLMSHQPIQGLQVEQLVDDIVQQLDVNTGTRSRRLTSQQLRLLDDFIDANIDQALSVISMANLVAMSAGHFSRVFKTSVGVSPFDYIIHKRLAYARHYLRYSHDDLSTIALKFGFSSHAHFTMICKKNLGLTPSALRKNG